MRGTGRSERVCERQSALDAATAGQTESSQPSVFQRISIRRSTAIEFSTLQLPRLKIVHADLFSRSLANSRYCRRGRCGASVRSDRRSQASISAQWPHVKVPQFLTMDRFQPRTGCLQVSTHLLRLDPGPTWFSQLPAELCRASINLWKTAFMPRVKVTRYSLCSDLAAMSGA
jgi:hypothetical protein